MTDILNKTQRSYNMSQIKAKNTKPEMKLRKMLFHNGLRGYSIHYGLIGKPDIVYPKYKLAIFVDGCFWHKCPRCFTTPDTRKEFWAKKIETNKKRDIEINKKLSHMGWTVLRFWEHRIMKDPHSVLRIIRKKIDNISYNQKTEM